MPFAPKTPRFGALRVRQTYREKIKSANAGDRHYAMLSGKPAQFQTELAPKRAYTKREREPGELSELQEQIRVVSWWDKNCHLYKLPPVALFAIPNGAAMQSNYGAANLVRAGMRKGVEDLFLAVANRTQHGLFIEMKIKGGSVEDEQDAMHEFHLRGGYRVMVAWSHQEAIELIQDYLVPF